MKKHNQYASLWHGITDELENDLMREELKKNHRRKISHIRRVVKVRYWVHTAIFILDDLRKYLPIFGILTLAILFFMLHLRIM